MGIYLQEAVGPTLTGVVTVGSRVGYEDDRGDSLLEPRIVLGKINEKFDGSIWPTIPCAVREEGLVGRATGLMHQKKQKKQYRLTFSWSPRLASISANKFYDGLCEYGFRLGRELEQEKVYIDFDGNTLVFKQADGGD